jgi:D-alanyl-D-alanine carboxypeptidase/D-alanyl-D-alanine-endopeptidase (penicillin-binding protein 4)
VNLIVSANGAVGNTPDIEWFPFNTDYVSFTNLQKITEPDTDYDEYYRRMPGNNNIRLASSLPQGYIEKEDLTIDEPALFSVDTFKRVLLKKGITLQGSIAMEHNTRNWNSSQYQLLSSQRSPKLKELVTHINKESDNFYTEMLVKEMGYVNSGQQGSTDRGLLAIRQFLKIAGIDTNLIVHTDGSGLSGSDLITAESVANLLNYMRLDPNFEVYFNSLPIAARDGSLKGRMNNSVLKDNIYAKTGYISGARALSGYIRTKNQRILTFSLITNNFAEKVSKVDRVHEAILEQLYYQY